SSSNVRGGHRFSRRRPERPPKGDRMAIVWDRERKQGFLAALKEQRWDDHRYYHHSLINQSLHLLSACSFVVAVFLIARGHTTAGALLAWGVGMCSRQTGHFFFEPKGYDELNQATHAYKEKIKVGYNIRRKVVLMSIWALSPLLLLWRPDAFGLFTP